MKLIKYFLFTLFSALICFACKSNNDEENKGYATVDNDGYATLKMNETCVISNGNNVMKVSFADVSDNRCPKSICYLCYGSEAHIFLSITNSENEKTKFNLSIIGCVDELDNEIGYDFVDTIGYRFRLVKLSPYPDLDIINKKDYSAKIEITKL